MGSLRTPDSELIDSANRKTFDLVFAKLNDFQKNVFYECICHEKAGLSLPLGSGKTILSILMALHFTFFHTCATNTNKKILIVVSKTLLHSWETEIEKFFGKDSLQYEVLHTDITKNLAVWKPKDDTKIVLTTADVIARSYRKLELKQQFVDQVYMIRYPGVYQNVYKQPHTPCLNHQIGEGILFSQKWGCLLVDEIQKYTNIETQWCQGLGSICSRFRWGLSGTIFDEPKVRNVLGFCVILDLPNQPRSLPEMHNYIYSRSFQGLNRYLVSRKENEGFIPPRINEHIITHTLKKEERIVYETLKHALSRIAKEAKEAEFYRDTEELRMLNSQKLTMILYLREALVCPMLPIASVVVSACDFKNRAPLSQVILNELTHLELDNWVNDENSVMSSRMEELIKCINKHSSEKVILYACFPSFLSLMEYFLKEMYNEDHKNPREIFMVKASMSIAKRKLFLENFKNSTNGILLVSYHLGAEGLNLQFASTVLLTDFWWNAGKIQQAIGRIFRFGQIRDEINVYFFTSNTGIEQILFMKQKAKLALIEEMKIGKVKSKVPRINMNQVIRLITLEENEDLLKNITFY